MSALRVVLVAPSLGPGDRALAATLDAIGAYGWQLVGIVAPEHHLQALGMVVDGEADAVIAARPEYVPAVMFTGDLVMPSGGGPRNERTQIPLYAEGPAYRTDRARRPLPIR